MIKKIISILLLGFITVYSQQSERIVAIGDSLVGKVINGESIRELHGNVVLTQGAVRITCERAIQYLAKNEAELIGKVVVTQDSIIVKTNIGYYYGDTKVAYSQSGVEVTDGHVKLSAKNGYYYFDENRSYFYEKVSLKEGVSNLTADKLNYYDDNDKAIAVNNVCVKDTASTLFADSLIYYRQTKQTDAYFNIRLYNSTNRVALFCNRLEDDSYKNYTKVWEDPFLVRIDTTSTGELDTLMVSSKTMESFNDSTNKLVAIDSVKMVRGGFSSFNSKTILYQKEDKIETIKQEGDENPPLLWNDNTQLVGDSVYIFIKEKKMDQIFLYNSATIISKHDNYDYRFDQISGKKIKIYFVENNISTTLVDGNMLSIYYVYDENEPNGLIKSSADNAKILFKEKEVSDVRLYVKPQSEYHPENLIIGKEKEFTIPTFKLYGDKPTKEKLLEGRKKILNYLTKDSIFYARKTASKK